MDFLNGITLIANYIIIPGLTYGSQLALGALGITIIYSILRFSNFAHGEFMSFGAMSSILLSWLFLSFGFTLHPLPTAISLLPFLFMEDAREYFSTARYPVLIPSAPNFL